MADAFEPFADGDTPAMTIGGLAIEGDAQRVSLSGSLDIAKDRRGLDQAKALRAVLDGVIAVLEAETALPARAAAPKPVATTRKPNPFA